MRVGERPDEENLQAKAQGRPGPASEDRAEPVFFFGLRSARQRREMGWKRLAEGGLCSPQ